MDFNDLQRDRSEAALVSRLAMSSQCVREQRRLCCRCQCRLWREVVALQPSAARHKRAGYHGSTTRPALCAGCLASMVEGLLGLPEMASWRVLPLSPHSPSQRHGDTKGCQLWRCTALRPGLNDPILHSECMDRTSHEIFSCLLLPVAAVANKTSDSRRV